jgi:hypothetical protein
MKTSFPMQAIFLPGIFNSLKGRQFPVRRVFVHLTDPSPTVKRRAGLFRP